MKLKGKIITSVTVLLLAAAALFVYIKFYYVFGEGVKAGELNFVVYKGYVWKTYEGRAIQAGFQKGSKERWRCARGHVRSRKGHR